MSFEVEGKLYKKFDTAQVTNTFKKREFVIELDGAYPQFISFQLTQDRCGILDSYNESDRIKVSFDLRGREWTSPKGEVKYFNSLNAWKIESANAAPAPQAPPTEEGAFPSASEEQNFDDNDDLPF